MKKKIPNYYAKNIFDVPVCFYKKIGVKNLLIDLDNTLDVYDIYTPSERVFKLKEELINNNINLYIISNNTGTRVSSYACNLGVKYLSSTRKPFGYKLRKFIIDNNLIFDECMLVGDQLITDVPCAIRTGIKVMLTDPISKKDQWTTRFNRLFDKPRRKRLIKRGIISHLKEEDYGK